MKKLTGKILAIAAAFAFASVFASCSFLDESDDSILSYFDPSALSAVNNGGSGNSGSSSGSGGSGESALSNYTLNIADIVAKGNVAATSSELSSSTGVTKIWASASGKSIQAFTATPSFVKMTGGGANVTSGAEYGLQVKVDANATVTITALSKQAKEACQWILKGTAGASDITSSGTPATASAELKSTVLTQDTTPATLSFSNVPAGTYILGAVTNGGYLFSLTITYN